MKLNGFSVAINEGQETPDGYVKMVHGTQYVIALGNETHRRCDAKVLIDGGHVGTWRINQQSIIEIERPVQDTGRFTFYSVGTPEALKAGIKTGYSTGLVSVEFLPERDKSMRLNAPAPTPGGTGLSGQSNQKFTSVEALDYDMDRSVTIHLRLMRRDDEPRPLFQRATPIPPPVSRSIDPPDSAASNNNAPANYETVESMRKKWAEAFPDDAPPSDEEMAELTRMHNEALEHEAFDPDAKHDTDVLSAENVDKAADPLRKSASEEMKLGPRGIGGWLVIPAIGLMLSPIARVLAIFSGFSLLSQLSPAFLETPDFYALVGIDAALIVFTIVVAINFFGCSPATKTLFPALLVASVIGTLISEVITTQAFGTGLNFAATFKPVVYAAIWIPYFLLSKRVANTFVKNHNEEVEHEAFDPDAKHGDSAPAGKLSRTVESGSAQCSAEDPQQDKTSRPHSMKRKLVFYGVAGLMLFLIWNGFNDDIMTTLLISVSGIVLLNLALGDWAGIELGSGSAENEDKANSASKSN